LLVDTGLSLFKAFLDPLMAAMLAFVGILELLTLDGDPDLLLKLHK
jgi:hypothetical protein